MGEHRTESKGALPPSKAGRSRRKRRGALFAVLFALLVAGAGKWLHIEGTVSALGFVASEEHAEVRAATPGVVTAIHVRTGERVERGDLLVQLDQREEKAALEEARSHYRKAEAELRLRRAWIREEERLRQADIRALEIQRQHVGERLERMRELNARGLVSGAALAEEKHQVRLLSEELEKQRSRDVDLPAQELQVLERDVEARRNAVALAADRLRRREIRAPISGQVLRYEFVIGEMVRSESVLLEIFGGERQILQLRISERYAMHVHPGDRYEARLGAYRGVVFEGNVERLRNVIQDDDRNPYRAAYCSFDADGYAVPPGTSAEARIYTGKQPLWRWILGLR